jgi:predicted transcriptional regulator
MRYVDFRDSICRELRRNPEGLTWPELRLRLSLPYKSPCSEWVKRMERENGLVRKPGTGRAYVWRVRGRK